jgi:hypothetical protein
MLLSSEDHPTLLHLLTNWFLGSLNQMDRYHTVIVEKLTEQTKASHYQVSPHGVNRTATKLLELIEI